MNLPPLVLRRLLDPRPAERAAARPIRDAVNIPIDELPARLHELPPRDRTILVAGEAALVERTIALLRERGRDARAAASYEFGPPSAQDPAAGAAAGAGDSIGRLWEPSPFLAAVLPRLAAEPPASRGDDPKSSPPLSHSPARALDLACGSGRDAVFLAAAGWETTGVDVLPDALDRARDLARRYLPGAEIEWELRDVIADPPRWSGRFDLICVARFLHRPLIPALADWLAPGGHVIYETFTVEHRARFGKPSSDAHVLLSGELPQLFAGWQVLDFSEGWLRGAHMARLLARKS